MRLVEHNGKRAEITESDRKKLMRRFNPRGLTEDGRRVSCVLCNKHMAISCRKCPLKIFARDSDQISHSDKVGCAVLIEAVIGQEVGILHRPWIKPSEVYGMGNIRKIYEALENLPKVQTIGG